MSSTMQMNRRRFVVSASAAGGGLALGWLVPWGASPAMAQDVMHTTAPTGGGAEVGVWTVIAPDDTVTVRIARSEMGQGTLTGLAQLVADELDADWSKVRAEYVAPEVNLANKRVWGDMSTGGSRGIRASVDYVRKGGATARAMLIAAAAQRWGVPAGECTAADSVVTHTPSGRKLRYGELAAAAAQLPPPADVAVKKPAEWKIIGKGVKRLDTADKLTGKQVFAIDVMLPDMLSAAIAQCPVFGGKLVRFDADKVKGMPGVRQVVTVDEATVAVVADKWWQAKTALAALSITWDEGPNAKVSSASIASFLQEGLDAKDAALGQRKGDVAAALAGAAKTVEAVYGTPFLSHATMEPMNCTARFTGDKVEIWVPTQNGDASLAAAAEAAGLPLSAVKVNKLHLGGGFGRRGQQDYVRQAVLIAKQVPGRPVKLIWSREEDTQHDFYRPVTQCKLTGGLDADGNLVALHLRLSGQSILAYLAPSRMVDGIDKNMFQGLLEGELGYMAVPNLLVDHAVRNTHVPVGFWRGVNANQNAIYLECFIDELAHAAGKDPLAFRRSIMGRNPKHLAVLNAVAEKAGWGTPLPAGVHRGICQFNSYGSYTAAVAEVSVSDQGALKIHRMVAATDCGHAVNPALIAAQVEGSFGFGLGPLLYSECTIENGRVVEGNFDTYQVARMADMPQVETVVMPSGGFWGGVGEPTIAVVGPAVLNAIFAATGKRIRTLPLTHHDLKRT
ncbi:xanthine dehydrogenase family protein molybdopterin-binding subunit [Limobrevibacterium gyesilva]|uniref:Molybdopterin-dependent oxidoreductase n=1 Tax=Limobrevibacterium gyesilva TaxID=2991712 RepID=A0AA41YP40_9PROT|nr:molybdopterin cofactor-binding domain-containing protein [Limobrevibacterium gyesilva]MCW3473920.1 molybdopterin-dependent oxidoreductase [Limobrevibacterium gyesilva]